MQRGDVWALTRGELERAGHPICDREILVPRSVHLLRSGVCFSVRGFDIAPSWQLEVLLRPAKSTDIDVCLRDVAAEHNLLLASVVRVLSFYGIAWVALLYAAC